MARGGVGAPLLLLASPPLLVLVLLLSSSCALLRSARGTDGFTAVDLPEALFKVQKPYDTPLDERYEFVDGMRRMWVSARVSKTGVTVQNRNSSTKNNFCIFGFRNIKYKKPNPVYRPGPDRKREKIRKPAVPVRFLKPWLEML